ncbi:uncharacterized protein BO80DRAFT_314628, partial [Aspergillus ibericus CBS 121593]
QPHDTPFCTQRCLLGLQHSLPLDPNCPNTPMHQRPSSKNHHPITTPHLLHLLNHQLNTTLTHNCTPLGTNGAHSAPFKLTLTTYGYTFIGKGSTTSLWPEISRESKIYNILRPVQGSAVPVFLGEVNLAHTYFLHGVGAIRHMLVMGWGGESLRCLGREGEMFGEGGLGREVERSVREIEELGVRHRDLHSGNLLWCEEVGRVLVIDFH